MEVPLVSVVVPGRNNRHTVHPCLAALLTVQERSPIQEIVFVDDGSTDDTAAIVAHLPVRLIQGDGKGAGAARNLGWRTAEHPFIWFVDADCVAAPDALDLLLPHLEDDRIAGVGGSYGNMNEDNLLACLIHEEIVARHSVMPSRVNFLATFNVVYRRDMLEELGGFDERYLKGQDAELAWRAIEHGHQLAFEPRSRVRHFHPVSWRSYLATQTRQGYWRVWLHLRHKGHARGDSYSSFVDHLQPPMAMAALITLPLVTVEGVAWLSPLLAVILALAQIPMTRRLIARTGQWRYAWFPVMGFVRAFARGIGMTSGVLAVLFGRLVCRPNPSIQSTSHRPHGQGQSR